MPCTYDRRIYTKKRREENSKVGDCRVVDCDVSGVALGELLVGMVHERNENEASWLALCGVRIRYQELYKLSP